MNEYEMPTTPGFYVAHTAISGAGDPHGALIAVLEEDGQWWEYPEWVNCDPEYDSPSNDLELRMQRYRWRMIRLVPEQ